MNNLAQAKQIVQWYREGSDLTESQTHILNDTADEYGQMLDNVVHMNWFVKAVAGNLEALADTGGEDE